MTMVSVGTRLKVERARSGRLQLDVANELEVPATTLANYENDRYAPPIWFIRRAAQLSASAWNPSSCLLQVNLPDALVVLPGLLVPSIMDHPCYLGPIRPVVFAVNGTAVFRSPAFMLV